MNRQSIEKLKKIQLSEYSFYGKDLAVAGFIKRYFAEFSPETVRQKIMIARANGVKYLLNQICLEIDQYLVPEEKEQGQVEAAKEWLLRSDLDFEELEKLLDNIYDSMQSNLS